MSRTAFANTFRKVVGQTPADYLSDWRMALAQSRLREGQPIKSLAEEIGYANPSALSRAFAAKVGMSPRDWLTKTTVESACPQRSEARRVGKEGVSTGRFRWSPC